MNLKFLLMLFAVLIALSFLPGCATKGTRDFASDYVGGLDWVAGLSEEAACKPGNCTCMVCKNGPGLFSSILSSMAGGECHFDKECTDKQFSDYNNASTKSGSNFSVRELMIGQGPSFYDYGVANAWCNDGLSMSVQWLIGGKGKPYDMPDETRAVCMLDKGVMPLYILYSKGENIDANRAGEIATLLKTKGGTLLTTNKDWPVGPTIIITELEFNGTNSTAVEQVADEVKQIDDKCNERTGTSDGNPHIYCMIGISPKIGDKVALDAVMEKIIDNEMAKGKTREEAITDVSRYVLLAYGMNSHYVNGTCSGDRMIMDARKFSKYARDNYSLASVIPYILIDANQNDSSNQCTWREGDVVSGYNAIFNSGLRTLQKVGVIGLALYTTDGNIYANPLGCVDCGVMNNPLRKKAWFGNCQNYYGVENAGSDGKTKKLVNQPLWARFPNSDGAFCGTGAEQTASSIFSLQGTAYAGQKTDILNPLTPELQQNVTSYWRCDACLTEKTNITKIFENTGGGTVIKNNMRWARGRISDLNAACTNYSEFDAYASRFNVDPMLIRALVMSESNLDPCAISRVCGPNVDPDVTQSNGKKCLQGKYSDGYDNMVDPSGKCSFEDIPLKSDGKPVYRFQAMGIMQVIESPYNFWPGQYSADGKDGEYYDPDFLNASNRGRKEDIAGVSATCSKTFNPFNITDSACWGTAKFAGMMQAARAEVDANSDLRVTKDPEESRVLAAFIAIYKYVGVWDANGSNYDPAGCLGKTGTVGKCWIDLYKSHNKACLSGPSSDGEQECPTGCVGGEEGGCMA
ncbi:MAG: hypothetical protein V1492_04100, partial [Candidatus Micrarchaeota archaeon]